MIKQRTRWARGVIQSCHNLHIFLNPNLSWKNRIILINTYLYWWTFARRLIYIAAPLLYALFKIQVVNANFWVLMLIWAPGYFLLHYVLGNTSSKIRNERWGEIQETFFAPYLFLPVLLESIGIKAKKFKVTEKNVTFSLKDYLYIIPYFVLWALTLIAIIKFNYGKWGSEIIVGSVITFWLVMHFINLSFCIFIATKRDIYRKSERFPRVTTGTLTGTDTSQEIGFTTRDVSEGGFSLQLQSNDDILKVGQKYQGTMMRHQTPIHFQCQVVRAITTDKIPWYAMTIKLSDLRSQNQYFELIHNGSNQLLPKEQDSWITPLDELHMNVILRLKKMERYLMRFLHQE